MMPNMSLQAIAEAVGAPIDKSHVLSLGKSLRKSLIESPINDVQIDSRHIKEGDLFVAFKGEHVDGHRYLADARRQGAAAALVEERQDDALLQLQVGDAALALGLVGRANREQFVRPVVALTGSAGKTTCKNMLAAILAERFSVCKTEGNLNNELGVPLTLASLSEQHDVAVIEMGAAQQGDIAYLVSLAKPHIAILTNVAEAHIGRFGDIQTTAKTKGEIYEGLPENGLAIVNADDRFADYWREKIAQANESRGGNNVRIVEFSLHSATDIYAESISLGKHGTSFNLNHSINGVDETVDITLPLLGRHNVANALAAAAAAILLGCSLADVKEGLSSVQAAPHRLELQQSQNALTLIDDSYNANPQAMVAALDVLSSVAGQGDRIVVFGDMAELGDLAEPRHFELGCEVAKRCVAGEPIVGFFVVGEYAEQYKRGYMSVDAVPDRLRVFPSCSAIAEELLADCYAGLAVLIKGSRSAALDEISRRLALKDVSLQDKTLNDTVPKEKAPKEKARSNPLC